MKDIGPAPKHGRIYVDTYDVDVRLAQMGLTRGFLTKCARRGDIERRSAPAYGYEGHAEYAAGSEMRHAMCALGGETEGGWHAGYRFGIPVAFNHSETIAIHATAGTTGTGRPDGDPHNKSLKGPCSAKASSPASFLDDLDDDDQLVDFFWFFTMRDDEGLWAELYEPILDESGQWLGYNSRIILGNVADDGDPMPMRKPEGLAPPSAPANIQIERTG